MHASILSFLRDPNSSTPLILEEQQVSNGEILEGVLRTTSGRTYPIRGGIPRFVQGEGYAENFGEQWNTYRTVQLDSRNGTSISRDRLTLGTRWNPNDLRDEWILEAGCGAGRFSEIFLTSGAHLVTFDFSSAVDACFKNNAPHPRLHVLQADIFHIPLAPKLFDRVFCYGVLQHTPDPKKAFFSLLPHLKPGGWIAIDLYVKRFRLSRRYRPTRWDSKWLYRPIAKRMPVSLLRKIVEWYVPRWLPWDNRLQKIPFLRWIVPLLIPCWNYTGLLPLSEQQIIEWAILDTFDALSARYDFPQTPSTVEAWFREAGLSDIDIRRGGNGIIANARKPQES